MNEAPETIWARSHPYEPDWTDDEELTTARHTKYRRADLPATDEQAFANEKVKALVDALVEAAKVASHATYDDGSGPFYTRAAYGLQAALAAMEK